MASAGLGQLDRASWGQPAGGDGLLAIANLPMPSHCCQVIAGHLNMSNSLWEQFAAGAWMESQGGGQGMASERVRRARQAGD